MDKSRGGNGPKIKHTSVYPHTHTKESHTRMSETSFPNSDPQHGKPDTQPTLQLNPYTPQPKKKTKKVAPFQTRTHKRSASVPPPRPPPSLPRGSARARFGERRPRLRRRRPGSPGGLRRKGRRRTGARRRRRPGSAPARRRPSLFSPPGCRTAHVLCCVVLCWRWRCCWCCCVLCCVVLRYLGVAFVLFVVLCVNVYAWLTCLTDHELTKQAGRGCSVGNKHHRVPLQHSTQRRRAHAHAHIQAACILHFLHTWGSPYRVWQLSTFCNAFITSNALKPHCM